MSTPGKWVWAYSERAMVPFFLKAPSRMPGEKSAASRATCQAMFTRSCLGTASAARAGGTVVSTAAVRREVVCTWASAVGVSANDADRVQVMAHRYAMKDVDGLN